MASQIIARIDGRDYNIIDGSLNLTIDQANSFEITLLANEFLNYRNARFKNIEIYEDGQLLVSGFIDKSAKLKMSDDKNIVISLKCLDELGRLTLVRAKNDAHYQDQQVLAIIADLFSVTTGWVTVLDNFIDPLIETTIDLRNKETLFAQIVEAIKSTPNVHLRYGGIDNSGNNILEIGYFGTVEYRAMQGVNLTDVTVDYPSNKVYLTVEAFGNISGDTKIDLQDALSDARTVAHPDYANFPISQDPITLAWIITNNTISQGANIRKSFNIVKTKNDSPPTPTEIAEAGYALWLKAVRFMQTATDYETYSGDMFLEQHEIPKVGDNLYLKSVVKEPVYDSFSGKIISNITTFSVDDVFRITKLKYKFGEQIEVILDDFKLSNKRVIGFDVTSNDEAEEFDPEIELFERLERYDEYDDLASTLSLYPIQITTVTYGAADAADTDASCVSPPGVLDAKEYTHVSPSYPVWATNVTTWYVIDSGANVVCEFPPAAVGDNWVGRVQDAGFAWPPASNITVTVFWLFS